MNPPTFEDYLKAVHAEGYTGTDDDMPDAFDAWVSQLEPEYIIELAELAVLKAYNAGFDRAAKIAEEAFTNNTTI